MTTTYLKASMRAHSAATSSRDALSKRLDPRDERGDVTPRTVGIAVMTAAAVAVGALITTKITAKEATISLD